MEIKCQLDATEVFIADLIACSTCFGRPLLPSSGALLTVTAATGVCHELGWNKSCIDVQGRLCTVQFHGQNVTYL